MRPSLSKKQTYPWTVDATEITADHTVTDDGLVYGINATGGDVTVTLPSGVTFTRVPRSWFFKRMDAGNNAVIVKLAVPSDSMYGGQLSSIALSRQGQGCQIHLNASGKYMFSEWSGVETLAPPEITTQTPTKFGGSLWMFGTLVALGSSTSVDVYFRYRDATTMSAWTETTKSTVTVPGTFSASWVYPGGDAAHAFDVQALVDDDQGVTHYGAVLQTTANYYVNVGEAAADGLERYWALQESAGTDTLAVEIMAGDDMTMAGGVTIASDLISGHTIYKRVFGASDWGQAGYAPNWSWSGSSKTILLQIQNNSGAGDHTMINFGRNTLSIGSDGTGVEVEVNSAVQTWAGAVPMGSVLNLFVVVDRGSWQTIGYTCTPTTRTQRTQVWRVPYRQAIYTRLARGTAGDGHHQDNEYLDNGTVRSLAIWDRVLLESEMKAICTELDTNGNLIVA